MPSKDFYGVETSVVRRLCFRGFHTQFAQGNNPAFTNHLFCDLVHRGQDATDSALGSLIRKRTVGDGEMSFFSIAAAVEHKLYVFGPGGGTSAKRGLNQRLEDIPDFMPDLRGWA